MHLHCNSDTSAAHWHDTVKVSQRTYDRRGARGGPHCTSTGELSHRGMFLNQASVRHHIAASKPCREVNMGIREILLAARAGDVMAGGGGAAGPAQDVRHQPADDVQVEIRNNILIPCQTQFKASTLVVEWSRQPRGVHEVQGSNSRPMHILSKCFVRAYTCIYRHMTTHTFIYLHILSISMAIPGIYKDDSTS
jgi:hypothetical protein